MCDFNNQDSYQPQTGRRSSAGKLLLAAQRTVNTKATALHPSLHLSPTKPLPLSQSLRCEAERRGACGRKTASFGKRCVGSLMLPLKVSFQVRFKEGGLAGSKQCCSEGTNLLDTGTSERCARDPEKFWIWAPNWALGITSALCLCRDC